MPKIEFHIPMDLEVWDKIADEIFSTAANGAIEYWANFKLATTMTAITAVCDITDVDGGEPFGLRTRVGYAELYIAVCKTLKENLVRDDIRNAILSTLFTGDASLIDSEAADALIQIAMFGEIRFS